MDVMEYGNKNAPIVLIQPVDDHDLQFMESEIALLRESIKDFRLLAFKIRDWNRDLSPWKAPAVFGKQEFGGGAEDTLNEILKHCEDRTKTYCIGGYSLWAVLFFKEKPTKILVAGLGAILTGIFCFCIANAV